MVEINQRQRITRRVAAISLFAVAFLCSCAGRQTQVEGHARSDVAHPIVGVWYTVVAGDTVASISERFGVPTVDIVELNGLARPDRLLVGQPLFLYGIDELVKRISKTSVPTTRQPTRSRRRSRGRYRKLVGPLIWPVKGAVFTSGFGPRGRRKHKGIDLAHKPGTPIYSVASGVVVYSDNKQRGYGNLVIIRHQRGVLSVYAHNKRNLVDEGDSVRQGSKIAELGNTGRSTGPHLHFELRVKGRAVNPLDYLPPKR
ncbi:MAG: LysM peptidoglycan-binding domain-containing M23 family metallopeptidase [Bradymonadia bacterium]